MKTICIASNNKHKVSEIKDLLKGKFDFKTLEEIGCFEEIEETENTLEANSLLKAKYIKDKYGFDCIADDSGLEVEALGGEPGVFSARYAGEPSDSNKNIEKLLTNLQNSENRSAQFRTVISLIMGDEIKQFEGQIKGKILPSPKGENGFGYDPIFMPDGYEKSFAEMSSEEKNPISHRGRAIQQLEKYLNSLK